MHFLKLRILFCALFCPFIASAFQLADAAPPQAHNTEKYILYWGKQQVDLTAANGYNSQVSLSPDAFRQMILNLPKLWDGKSLVKSFSFKLDETTLNTATYLDQFAQLDADIGSKIKVGNTLKLRSLSLSNGARGAIDFLIEQRDEETVVLYGNAPGQRKTTLNNALVERVVWGREDILASSNRDFFTVREFWQSIRQEPVVLWQYNLVPQPLRCVVDLVSKDKVSMGFAANLEEIPYSSFLESVEPYRHMVHPGSAVSLKLQTAGQYDQLYQKNIIIVADDDPRLRLRGSKDYHEIDLNWGSWRERISELYLLSGENKAGEKIPVDLAIARNSAMFFAQDSIGNWAISKPECSIDGVPVSGNLTFRVVVNDSLAFQVQSATYKADAVAAFFNQFGTEIEKLRIDSVAVEGYELPPMVFAIYNMRRNGDLLVQNDFTSLQILSERPKKTSLSPPEIGETELVFKFELLKTTRYAFSIFEPDGRNIYLMEAAFSEGAIEVKAPRNVVRKSGKHLAFLNTTYGVWKVEFEVE